MRITKLLLLGGGFLGFVLACEGAGSTRRASRPDAVSVSQFAPLAWDDATNKQLYVTRIVRRSDSAGSLQCDSTGIYSAENGRMLRLVYKSEALCRALAHAQRIALSPKRTEIVFADPARDGAIMKLDLVSGVLQPLAQGCTRLSSSPQWAPAGGMIALTYGCGRNPSNLHRITLPSSDIELLGDSLVRRLEDEPSWHPGGEEIAFTSRDSAGRDSVRILSVRSGRRRSLVEGRDPSWSPDGTLIAYLSAATPTSAPSIRVVGADGRGDRELLMVKDDPVDAQARAKTIVGPIVWSADSRRILFARGMDLLSIDMRNSEARSVVDSNLVVQF